MTTPRQPLAVIGMGCRFPGGMDSAEQFWQGLMGGIDAIRLVPADRWDHRHFYDPDAEKAGKIKNALGGFIEGIDRFDADFFGYFPAEAGRIDPQQRLLLEVVHEAVEDAGIPMQVFRGSRTSVFVGSFMYDYLAMQSGDGARDAINPYVAMGTGLCAIASRVSYQYDLKGPSVSLDTACSSSLVAVHMAAKSVWNGEADVAIAAGVNVIIRPEASILLSKAGFLSPDGYCKSFDASGNGYVRSEGIGVVILKPLAQAILDGDDIYAVVRGTALNQDGFVAEGFTVPSGAAQERMLRTAYQDAGVDPATIDYVEAHGPGTVVGDPIETGALGAVIGTAAGRAGKCLIGSVKSNVGHLEGGSGIIGFMKAALVARHKVVPPNLHFNTPNPGIDFEGLRLQVPTAATPIAAAGRPARVGVNSFGAGGTNAHVVLESFDGAWPVPGKDAPLEGVRPVVLAAKSQAALAELAEAYVARVQQPDVALRDVARSLLARRSRYAQAVSIACRDKASFLEGLQRVASGQAAPNVAFVAGEAARPPRIAFMFSGQGGQWARMGMALYEAEPAFRASMDEIDAIFQGVGGWSIMAHIDAPPESTDIDRTRIVQPCVMAIQVSLARLLIANGVQPTAIVGHSIGEVAAAHIAGALTLEQAVHVIYHRSSVQDKASGKGRMLAVGITEDEALAVIAGVADRVSLATVNGPTNLTLSGDVPELEAIAAELERQGKFCRFVRVDVPYHSHHMAPLEAELTARLAGFTGQEAAIPLYSTVSGAREVGTHLGGDYWYQNVRKPVLMTKALAAMAADGFDAFVEVGPHPVLVAGAQSLFKSIGAAATTFTSMKRGEAEPITFAHCLGALIARGWPGDAAALYGADARLVKLPRHPWRHERVWSETPESFRARVQPHTHPFIERVERLLTDDDLSIWESTLGLKHLPFLRDHRVDGEAVFPGTAHLELARAVASQLYPNVPCHLENLKFTSALVFPEETRSPLQVRLDITSNEGDYKICSRSRDAAPDTPWNHHSSGRINHLRDTFPTRGVSLHDIRSRFQDRDALDPAAFYATIQQAGLGYGPMFQGVKQLWHAGHEVLSRVELPPALAYEATHFGIHPAMLDACLHTVFADVHQRMGGDRVYLPYEMKQVRLSGRTPQAVWTYIDVSRLDDEFLEFDVWLLADDGTVVAEMQGVTCKIIAGAGSRQADRLYEGSYEYRWREAGGRGEAWRPLQDLTSCTIVSSDLEAAAQLTAALDRAGLKTRILSLAEIPEVGVPREVLGGLFPTGRLDRRSLVVFLAGADTDVAAWREPGAMAPEAAAFMSLAKWLVAGEVYPRLALVTRNATSAGAGEMALGQAPMLGMMRVIKTECPNLPVKSIDLPTAPTAADWAELGEELRGDGIGVDDFEVALRDGRRLVRELEPVSGEAAERDQSVMMPGVGGAYRAVVRQIGLLDSLAFRRLEVVAPAADQVEIEVMASGLNFKDLVNAMGILSQQAVRGGMAADQLGLEVAGRVLRCGAEVTAFAPGDEVIARVANGFGGRVLAPVTCVVRKPAHLTFPEAAAIPVVYMTAHYGLNVCARMAPGETVLVHSAAGGVGVAAIRMAHLAGCRVIATAGTKAKRDYVRSLGVEHVFDSRSLDFWSQVMEATQGRGVDVVLNSLTGNAIIQSVKCLAPFGRFIEIGKMDIYKNSKLNLERLGENISFFVVDVDRLAKQKPALHQLLLHEIAEMFEARKLLPHEISAFPIGQLPKALKFMSRSAYYGKVVVTMEGETVEALPPVKATFHADGCYLITGGASGFGLELAQWLARNGARHLVLASRSGAKLARDREAVDDLRAGGVAVEEVRLDVGDAGAVKALFARFGRELPRLRGVVHSAAVLEDTQLRNLDQAAFMRVFTPKALGAWHLHEASATLEQPLDHFLLLSSISSVLGLFGQANYASANFLLDSLAESRRRQGLAATSVNLGVLGEFAGMSRKAMDTADVLGLLESHGMAPMTLSEAIAKLEAALNQQATQRMIASFAWTPYLTAYPHVANDRRFVAAIAASRGKADGRKQGDLLGTLAALEPAARVTLLEEKVLEAIAGILDTAVSRLDAATPIERLALDSLMLNQLRNWLLRNLEINYPLIKLLKGPSVTEIAAELAPSLAAGKAAGEAAGPGAPAAEEFGLAHEAGIEILSPWLIRGAGDREAGVRLFCFHSMGVGASLFSRFLLEPPPGTDILAVQTPGRENRLAEPGIERISDLVDRIIDELLPMLDRPFVFWGHSFGGIVAFEVLRKLQADHGHHAAHFMVTGTTAPDLVALWQSRDVLQKALVADTSAEYLISVSRYVEDTEFIKAILPMMRQDIPLLMSYAHQLGMSLHCPITAFAALQDDMVYPDEIAGWSRQTVAEFELVEVDGDHWFLNRNRAAIMERLGRIAGLAPGARASRVS